MYPLEPREPRIARAVSLPILLVFLIAITPDCLQPSRVVLGPTMCVDDWRDNPEVLLVEDESDDDAPNSALAENILLSSHSSIFALAPRIAELAAVQITRSTVLRL
jgi:hypothetical protein